MVVVETMEEHAFNGGNRFFFKSLTAHGTTEDKSEKREE